MAEIIKFEKENCGPCNSVSNYLENEAKVAYTRMNPFNGGRAAELAAKYQIGFQVPVVVLVDDEGNKLDMSRGYQPEELDAFAAQVNK
jgi:thioredoxin 1